MWKSLFHFKFYEWQDSLSAAWLGTRIKRVALSRKNLFQERLGYIEGGSEMLLEAIAARMRDAGGWHRAWYGRRSGAGRRKCGGSACKRLTRQRCTAAFDRVISTIPLPYLVRLIPELPADERSKVAAIRNAGVVCVLLKLKRPYTRNFWMNINDPRIEIPGLIESQT